MQADVKVGDRCWVPVVTPEGRFRHSRPARMTEAFVVAVNHAVGKATVQSVFDSKTRTYRIRDLVLVERQP